MVKPRVTQLVRSASAVGQLPHTQVPEVALVGKSNVGKSSLLNALAGSKIARTSKTPGRTQLINLFRVDGVGGPAQGPFGGAIGLVDLPGYGFAQAPPAVRAAWMDMIDAYLAEREELALGLVLVDARRGPDDDDREVFDWFRAERRARRLDVVAVATKLDKLTKAQQKPAVLAIARALGGGAVEVVGTSAETGLGIDLLEGRIAVARRSFVSGRAGDPVG